MEGGRKRISARSTDKSRKGAQRIFIWEKASSKAITIDNKMSRWSLTLLSFVYFFLANPHRLDDFICMKPGKDNKLGEVFDLLHFVQAFYKSNNINNTKTQN